MHERHRGLTKAIAQSYQEAASVCLSRHHNAPLNLAVSDNGTEGTATITWTNPDERTRGAWGNAVDATEAGAYACILATVEELRGVVAVRRAETGTGADYYIGPPGSGVTDVEDCLRLEISGIDVGSAADIARRLVAKTQQAREGTGNLPALAGVIGFSRGVVMIQDVPEQL